MTSVNVAIMCNNKSIKDFKESIDFTKTSLNEYVNKLHSMQKNVNIALTEIVEQEKTNQQVTDEIVEDDGDDDSDEDEKPAPTSKRKIITHEYEINKKLKT